jgi:hypothetical protein
MNSLEEISNELKEAAEGLEADLEAYRDKAKFFLPRAGRWLPQEGGGVYPKASGTELRLLELDVAAAESVVRWHRPGVLMPDNSHTVLVYAAHADGPVWLGYHDGECWRAVDGMRLERVELWGEIPHPGRIQEAADRGRRAVNPNSRKLRKEAVCR